MKKITKNNCKFIILSIIFVIIISTCCLATSSQVTKNDLMQALKEVKESDSSLSNESWGISDQQLKLTIDGKEFLINYNLGSDVTFSVDMTYSNYMSDDEYDFQEEKYNALLNYAFVAYAMAKGADREAAEDYVIVNLVSSSTGTSTGTFSGSSSEVDLSNAEITLGDGSKIYGTNDDIIETAKSSYNSSMVVKDSSLINAFNVAIKVNNETSYNYSVTATLTIDPNKDLSIITKDYINNIWNGEFGGSNSDTFEYNLQSNENISNEENSNVNSDSDNIKKQNSNKVEIDITVLIMGIVIGLLVMLVIILIIALIAKSKVKNRDN